MDPQLISVFAAPDGYRVIQILGVFPVDGDHPPAPQILPPLQHLFAHLILDCFQRAKNRIGKFSGYAEPADDGLNLCGGLISMPQILQDFSPEPLLVLRPGQDPYHHFMPVLILFGLLHPDVNCAVKSRLIRPDIRGFLLVDQGSN